VFFCLYCGIDKPDGERSLEHPLAQSIGGSGWSTRQVCRDCNAYCGKEVDRPFADDFLIQLMRHRFGVVDARRVVPKAPRLLGRTPSGQPVRVEFGSDAIVTRRVPHRTHADESHETYITEVGEGEEILGLRVQRTRQRLGPGYEVRGRVKLVDDAEQQVRIEVSTHMDLWARFGAKLGLGLAGAALDDAWARSQWAYWLRARLRGRELAAPDPRVSLQVLPDRIDDGDTLSLLTDPPTHTIFTVNGSTNASLMVHLFGSWRYVVPLGPLGSVAGPAWTFDPQKGTAVQTTLMELIAANRHRWRA
jgi:hypothetical protein